jgi:FMN phosphatase YigB (HAD superfamily)
MQRRKIDALGLKRFVDSYRITPDKSEADSLKTLLSDLEAVPERSWYVGDNPNKDFCIPSTLGMTTVRIRSGVHKDVTGDIADRQINTIGEIIELVVDV